MEPTSENSDWLDQVQTGWVSSEVASRLRRELCQRPRELSRLEDELALNGLLEQLPDAVVPSNLASRVLDEIRRHEANAERSARGTQRWFNVTRIFHPAIITMLVAFALGGWWQFRMRDRQNLADSVTVVSRTVAVPGVEYLQDFDAIQLLRTPSQPGDLELIAALATP